MTNVKVTEKTFKPSPLTSSMYSDKETHIDALGFEPYVDSLSELIVEKGITPFTIGVFGTWGTGKTSLMRMLEKKLESSNNESSNNVKTVWFNAWKFEEREQIWTALIQTILDHLELSIGQKAKREIQELRDRVEWIQIFGFLGKSIISGWPDFDFLRKSFRSRKDIQSIADFEEKFENLINICEIRRLVIFIDDLDRCEMDATLNILEAIKLLLGSKKCIYILGLDYERTCNAVSERFAKDSKEIAENYLEKIIQLSFHIPRRTEEDMKLFLRYLFALRYLEEQGVQEFARDIRRIQENIDEEFPKLLKSYVKEFSMDEYKTLTEYDLLVIRESDFNPRKLKRFLNIYELRRSLSKAFGLDLKNEYIIKFLLLQIKFADFYRDLEGYPDLLKDTIELISLSKEKVKEKIVQSVLLERHFSNNELLSFLKDAKLEDLDPRPYLSIAEPTRLETAIIGKEEEKTLRDLMSADSVKFQLGISNFEKLSAEKKERVIRNLIGKTEHRKIEIRKRSGQVLEKMGLANILPIDLMEEVIRKLIERTDDRSVLIRKDALQALGEMRDVIPRDLIEDVVGKLIERTDDKSYSVKRNALRILREMRKVIPEDLIEDIVDKLIEKTDDKSDSVKEDAFRTLGEMRDVIPEDLIEDVVDKLIEKTRDERYFVADKALKILKDWRGRVLPQLKEKIDQNI